MLVKVAYYTSGIARSFFKWCTKLRSFWKLCYFLFKCVLQKKEKQTSSNLYIWRQLSMKSSLFWKTYSDKTKINIGFQTRSSDLTSQNVSFSLAPFFACESGNYKRCNLYYGCAQSSRQQTILYYGNPLLPAHWKPENRHEPWTEFENNRSWRPRQVKTLV